MDFSTILEQVTEYVQPELLVLVPVLYFIGMGLKKTEKISDQLIPALLGIAGVVLSGMWVLGTEQIIGWQQAVIAVFTAIVQGILCAGMSVYINQLIKQAKKTGDKEKTDLSE